MEQYGSSLLRMSALYLKDADLAQDAVQETFIKAYRHLNEYRGESSEKTWLTTICVNTCRDMLRTAWFRHQSRIDMDTLPEKPADFTFPDNTVLTEVMHLPVRYREVVLLRYTKSCMFTRNRYLVDNADLLLAAYDGQPGGTQMTVRPLKKPVLFRTDFFSGLKISDVSGNRKGFFS